MNWFIFDSMGRMSAYLLLLVIAASNLPFSQVCKIPTLLQHFQEHQQRNNDLSFIEFLGMHYGGDDQDDDDNDRDMELPLKKESIVYSAYYVAPVRIQIKLPSTTLLITHSVIDHCFRQDAHLGSLFRPPKHAA